ncbi:MAG: universal stress protein [Nitrosopumilaceae archaeon]|nr:universal stress protein [Nitrosopumilaceae archaeon]
MVIKIKNILVPLDGSKNSIRGLEHAIYLARECQATITAVYAKHLPTAYALHPLGFMGMNFSKTAKKILGDAKTRAAKKGVLLKQKMLSGGDSGYDIVKYAEKSRPKFDVIVIGARGQGSTKAMFFGSVSNYVSHKSKIPVLIVK